MEKEQVTKSGVGEKDKNQIESDRAGFLKEIAALSVMESDCKACN